MSYLPQPIEWPQHFASSMRIHATVAHIALRQCPKHLHQIDTWMDRMRKEDLAPYPIPSWCIEKWLSWKELARQHLTLCEVHFLGFQEWRFVFPVP